MRAKTACYEDLRMRVLTMVEPPGADLDEATLSSRYGISRTPLREVLQRLAGAGYVELSPHRGAKVAAMDLMRLRTFFQSAPLVYASVARQAAENRQESELAQLQAAQSDFVDALETAPGAAALANHRFHEIIGDMAHNPYLVPALHRLLIDHTRLGQTFYRPGTTTDRARIATARSQHDAMIDAIAGQRPAEAVALTLAHWDLSRDRIEQFVRPDPLPIDPVMERRDAV